MKRRRDSALSRTVRPAAIHPLIVATSMVALSACAPDPPPAPREPPQPIVQRNQERFGLTFEERMAIPPDLSRIRAEAARRADEIYDPFRSREAAIKNESLKVDLYNDARDAYLAERGLNRAQLDAIVEEYQTSLGANLR